MPDQADRGGQQWRLGPHDVGVLDVALPRRGPQFEPGAVADVGQLGGAVDVDDVRGAGQPKPEKWDEALAAGHDLGFIAQLPEEADGLVNGLRGVVVERRRLHAVRSLPPRSTATRGY